VEKEGKVGKSKGSKEIRDLSECWERREMR